LPHAQQLSISVSGPKSVINISTAYISYQHIEIHALKQHIGCFWATFLYFQRVYVEKRFRYFSCFRQTICHT